MGQKGNIADLWTSMQIHKEVLFVICTVFSMNRRLYTCLDYVYKDWKIYVQDSEQW